MPTDTNGNYSLPPAYLAVTGELVEAAQHNQPLEDIAASLTKRLTRDGNGAMLSPLNLGSFRGVNAAAAVDPTDLTILSQVQALIAAAGVPAGVVQAYAGPTLPAGWLWCDGAAVSRTTYAALFAAIGTTWGGGDGSTTFNLPNASGRFPRFLPRTGALDPGRVLGSLQADEVKSHNHTATSTVTDPGHNHGTTLGNSLSTPGGAFPSPGPGTGINTTLSVTGITVSTTVASAGGTETRPVNIAFNAIIKV